MKRIKHQTQPTGITCVATCIAMVINRPATQVIAEFHEKYFNPDYEEDATAWLMQYLTKQGCEVEPCFTHASTLYNGNIYLVLVPSLNNQGLFHCCVYDLRDEDNHEFFDPALGRKNSWSYTIAQDFEINPMEKLVGLQTWIPLVRILSSKNLC